MTVQLSAASDSPLPINWKAKSIEIALPCVAPISSMNSFLRSSTRLSGTGSNSALKTDLDALMDSGPAGTTGSTSSKQPNTAESKPATRRSARLRGEDVEESAITPADAGTQAPTASADLKDAEHRAEEDDDDDDHSTQNGEEIDAEHADEDLHSHIMGGDMLLDDEDDDDDMDDEMEGDGIVSLQTASHWRRTNANFMLPSSTQFLEDHLDDDDPDQDDEVVGDQLQEKTVDLEVPSGEWARCISR